MTSLDLHTGSCVLRNPVGVSSGELCGNFSLSSLLALYGRTVSHHVIGLHGY